MPIAQGTYIPIAPSNATLTAGNNYSQLLDHTGGTLVSEMHGKYYNASKGGNVYSAFSTVGITVPVNAATLASTFSIWNPIGSGKNLEIISADVGVVLATTVVDTIGLVFQANLAASPTLTTAGTAFCGGLLGPSGAVAGMAGRFYTALTHAGTPAFCSIIGSFGAVTSTADNPIHRDFDGTILLPPASVISFAMSTAASTTSGIMLGLTWAEWPI